MTGDEKARAKAEERAAQKAAKDAARAAEKAAKAAAKAAEKEAKAAAKAADKAEIERKIAAATVEWTHAIDVANADLVRRTQEAWEQWDRAAEKIGDDFLNGGIREQAFKRSMEAIDKLYDRLRDAAWVDFSDAKDAANAAFERHTGGWGPPYRHPGWPFPGCPDTTPKPRSDAR